MIKKKVLQILVLMFLPSALIITSSAQEREAGVNVGDWFKYSVFDVNWSSDDPDAAAPWYVKEMNEIEWMKVTIASVIGTNVTGQSVVHFRNGTEDAVDFWIDVDTCDGADLNWGWFPISANLDANDSVWSPDYYSDWRINETMIRTYPDGARETNCLNITLVDDIPWDYQTVICYWDRSNGVPVEWFIEEVNIGEEYFSCSTRITESNVWTIPEFPTWASMLLMLIVLSVIIAIYRRRLLKNAYDPKKK